MSAAAIVVAIGLALIVAIGYRQRSRVEPRDSASQLTLLLASMALGGGAICLVGDLPLMCWGAVGLITIGTPIAWRLDRAARQRSDDQALQCGYESYLWELPTAVFAAGVGFAGLQASDSWTIRAASVAALAGSLAALSRAAVFALLSRSSGLSWIHYQLGLEGFRFPSRHGQRFVRWDSVLSIEAPKNPDGLEIWFRPFTIRFETDGELDTFAVTRSPHGYTFDQIHQLMSGRAADASPEPKQSSC